MNIIILASLLLIGSICARDLSSMIYDNTACYSCIDSYSSYACSKTASSSTGYCCYSWESKSNWLGSDYNSYVCSNEGLPGRAQNLLCPKETYDCGDTQYDFAVSQEGQIKNITTGIVSPGKTCQYRTYINTTSSSNTQYNVTVSFDYVYYQTYFGIYKYHTDSNTYELVTEVGRDYTGNITGILLDTNTEIHLQMHPFSNLSCAGLSVYVEEYEKSPSENSKLHVAIVVVIVLAAVWFSLVLGAVGLFFVYMKFIKPRYSRKIQSTDSKHVEVISGVPNPLDETNVKLYKIDNIVNYNNQANKDNTDANSSSKPPSENDNLDGAEHGDIIVQGGYPEVILPQIQVIQQQPNQNVRSEDV